MKAETQYEFYTKPARRSKAFFTATGCHGIAVTDAGDGAAANHGCVNSTLELC